MNIAFGLLPELPHHVRDKAKKRLAMAHRALETLARFQRELDSTAGTPADAARAAG